MNETLQTIHSLRSIHGNFSKRPISQADLEKILEAGIQAANASARQSYAIIVLDDREAMQRLFSYQGSHALIFCVDYNRIMATAEHLGHQFDDYHIIGFITAAVDTTLAVQNAVVAAKSLGIDSLITNGLHRNDLDTVYRELNLPEEACFPLITVVLGYPEQEPAYKKGRLSSEFLVHFGQYTPPSEGQLDRIVAEYDDHTTHVGLIDNWEELGFDHYLDWFYTEWSSKSPATKIASGKTLEFEDRLVKSGFWWPMV
jgi:nitroreductase